MQAIEKRLDDARVTLSAIPKNLEGIEMRLRDNGSTLSTIPTNLEAIKTQLEKAKTTLSLIPTTVDGIDQQMLDIRIAQPVNLSYLTGADCVAVQRALKDFYKGRVDGKCDGATNAAAQEWQIQNRRTIAPAHSADQIVKTLGTQSEQSVNTGR